MDRNRRIEELEASIVKHQDLYYNAAPEITDADFDALWDELVSLDPGNAVLRKVGEDSLDGFPKAPHVIPMGSQAKAADPESFLAWAAKMKHPEYLVQWKLDGASLELQYEKGVFRRAVTRGNGLVGDDITANARSMRGVVRNLDPAFSGGVRGEVVMSREILKTKFPDKANCRNAANGLMKRKDGIGAEHLDVICYDVAHSSVDAFFKDESSKLEWLKAAGFKTVTTVTLESAEDVIEYRGRVMAERPSMEYDIDGLVVKANAIDREDMKRARPERQIAFKFSLEEAVTTLLGVEWSESGATYTPVGLVEPVKLAGTTVKRASLSNVGILRALDLRIGSRIVVTKRGEIIPKIECLVETPPGAVPVTVPESCSACGTRLQDDGTRLFCPEPSCPKRALHRLEKWISVIDAKDFGPVILGKLFDSGRVRNVSDLYTLTEEDFSRFDRMGETLARKILQNLERVYELSFPKLIAGYDIDGIGELIAERFAQAGYADPESLSKASPEDLSRIDGIGDITARAVLAGLSECLGDMRKTLSSGKLRLQSAPAGGILSGMNFCFTGELVTMKRSEAEALVKSLGGGIKSGVTKDLAYLVTNDPGSGSSKNAKARELGVKIASENEFLALAGKGKQ